MKKIAFTGTLDPITNGHMWVIEEARSLADEVTVFLSENAAKRPQFPAEKRKQIIELSAAERGWHNVNVVIVKGDYTARAAKKHGIDYLIRGIRNTADFDYENLIQQTNVDVLHGAKTIFVMPPRDLGSVSSSFVGALQGPVGWNWNVRKFVPGPAHRAWMADWLRREWDVLWQSDSARETGTGHGADALPTSTTATDPWFDYLTGDQSHGGAQRHYHNLDHLVHGLTEIRVWGLNTGAGAEALATLKKAFWFHDAVLETSEAAEPANDSEALSAEERSARIWQESLAGAGSDTGTDAGNVAALIRATDPAQAASIDHPLKAVMLALDRAILGQDEDVYDHYAQGIRREYRHLSDRTYAERRRQALAHLLQEAEAGSLFGDDYFVARYNDSAIGNMRREVERLAIFSRLAE